LVINALTKKPPQYEHVTTGNNEKEKEMIFDAERDALPNYTEKSVSAETKN
jgi:hypothetical protein